MGESQQAWPRQWLMTDERLGDRLWEAIDRLPEGKSGIVLRHYATRPAQRAALGDQIATLCRQRGLTLAVARDEVLARRLGAQLVHNPADPAALPVSRSVHSPAEARTASGAALVFVSPVFPTRSHPGAEALGEARAGEIAATAGVPAIALGGMDARKFARLGNGIFYGWAGIDAWLRT